MKFPGNVTVIQARVAGGKSMQLLGGALMFAEISGQDVVYFDCEGGAPKRLHALKGLHHRIPDKLLISEIVPGRGHVRSISDLPVPQEIEPRIIVLDSLDEMLKMLTFPKDMRKAEDRVLWTLEQLSDRWPRALIWTALSHRVKPKTVVK